MRSTTEPFSGVEPLPDLHAVQAHSTQELCSLPDQSQRKGLRAPTDLPFERRHTYYGERGFSPLQFQESSGLNSTIAVLTHSITRILLQKAAEATTGHHWASTRGSHLLSTTQESSALQALQEYNQVSRVCPNRPATKLSLKTNIPQSVHLASDCCRTIGSTTIQVFENV